MGYRVYAINPLSVARYRDRHVVSGAKSDAGDADVLADLLRTDRHAHRPVAGDSELAEAVKVLARTHQSLIWSRQRQANVLRSTLREFYPAALVAFDQLAGRDALAVLDLAPTPIRGRGLSRSKIASALRRAGRQRHLDTRAEAIQAALRSEQLPALPAVEVAFGDTVTALVRVPRRADPPDRHPRRRADRPFDRHPDAEILRSQPGLATVLAARVLAEFGDDPHRFANAKARSNYAAASPLTHASGTRRVVFARVAANKRLRDALHWQASPATRIARRPRPLRQPPCPRRHPPAGPARPGQPTRRHPPRLPPPPPPALQRIHRLAHAPRTTRPSSLTRKQHGMSGQLPW